MRRGLSVLVAVLMCAACGDPTSSETASDAPTPTQEPSPSPTEPEPESVLMPDLVGLRETAVGEALGELNERTTLDISSSWMPESIRDCSVPPGTAVRQSPAPGSVLRKRTEGDIEIWIAELDLERFRGPCDPADGELGPVRGADARLAREFYRFAADPALGAPFVDGDVWVGIEGGPAKAMLSADERADLAAWRFYAEYAERAGDMSPLDTLAASGGLYEVHRGVRPTCAFGYNEIPPDLAHLRAVTLAAAADTTSACMDWWGVVLYLDEDRIAGVALKLGAP